MRFELDRWGDGEIRLMHWDSLGGRDIEIKLATEGATVMRQPVDLAAYLCELIEAQERARPDYVGDSGGGEGKRWRRIYVGSGEGKG